MERLLLFTADNWVEEEYPFSFALYVFLEQPRDLLTKQLNYVWPHAASQSWPCNLTLEQLKKWVQTEWFTRFVKPPKIFNRTDFYTHSVGKPFKNSHFTALKFSNTMSNVWKLLKMSHFVFLFWHFPLIFVKLKLTYLVILFDHKFQVF